MNKKSAFTLIELLVVVAIIAILAALLFPSLRAFHARGHAADCANNLSSLGKVIQQYTMDQKGTFFSASASGEDTWPKILYRNYTSKDWRPFRSPFDKPTDLRPKNKTEDPVPVSYGINEKLFDTFEGNWKSPRSTLIMAAPALDLSYDGKEIRFKPDAFSTANIKLKFGIGDGKPTERGHGTHEERQKINVLFADGHVSPMEIHKYEDGTTDKGKMQWDPFF
jgi:prepilin-type N-terminal cleavage/methylation domain-containing protein/prepilin-type processing-associated H-X9-DG protein